MDQHDVAVVQALLPTLEMIQFYTYRMPSDEFDENNNWKERKKRKKERKGVVASTLYKLYETSLSQKAFVKSSQKSSSKTKKKKKKERRRNGLCRPMVTTTTMIVTSGVEREQRGIDHYVAARYSEAERACTEARAISTRGDPALHLYDRNRCAARMNLEKIRDALLDAKKTTELKRDFAKGWSRLGQCLHRESVGENPADVRKLEEAKRALEKCLSIASENEEARRTLRIVEEKLNAEKERRTEERASRNVTSEMGLASCLELEISQAL